MKKSAHAIIVIMLHNVLNDDTLSIDDKLRVISNLIEPCIKTAYRLNQTTIKPVELLTVDDLV